MNNNDILFADQVYFSQRSHFMSTRLFRTLSALSGIVGAIMLITSFSINPGPPSNATSAQLIAFGNQYFTSVLWGAWLQAVGPLLSVLFAFAIVCLAGATTRLAGWMTLFGGTILMMVSLVEITFYMTALYSNPATMGLISLDLIHAVQHLYFIVAAPALFLPLGFVILGSHVLPRVLGYLALVLGAAFAILGVASLFTLTLPAAILAFGGLQTLWWVAAAITLIVGTGKTSNSRSLNERAPLVSPRA
jgi:hypothetical protein